MENKQFPNGDGSGATVRLGDLIEGEEVKSLVKFVESRGPASVHNAVMAWLDKHPVVLERMRTHGLIKAYFAYMLEYVLFLR